MVLGFAFLLLAGTALPAHAQDKNSTTSATEPQAAEAPAPANPRMEERNRLTELGNAAYNESRWADLEPLSRALLKEEEADLGVGHPDTGATLGWLADSLQQLGRYPEAVEVYRRAIPLVEQAQGSVPQAVAVLRNGLGLSLNGIGRPGEAEPEFRAALAVLTTINSGETADVVFAHNNLGLALSNLRRFTEAEAEFRTSLALARKISDPKSGDAGYAIVNLGYNLYSQAKYREAEALFREAAEIFTRTLPADHASLVGTKVSLAQTLDQQGRSAEAEVIHREIMATLARKGFANDPYAPMALSNYGLSLVSLGRLDEAQAILERGIAEIERTYGANSRAAAFTIANLGGVMQERRDKTGAATQIRKAIAIVEALPDGEPNLLAKLYNNLAVAIGSSSDEGVTLLGKALAIRQKMGDGKSPEYALALYNLASSLYIGGQRDASLKMFRQSLDLNRQQSGEYHPALLQPLSGIAMVQGDEDSTEADQKEALSALREAARIIRRAGGKPRSGGGEAMQRVNLIRAADDRSSSQQFTFLQLADLLHKFHARSPDRALADEAFLATQESQGQGSARALARTAARVAAGRGQLGQLVQRQQDLTLAIQQADQAILSAIARGDAKAATALQAESSAQVKAVASLDQDIALRFPNYADLITPKPLTLSAVQKRLKEDEALVFALPTLDRYYVFTVTSDEVAWHASRQTDNEIDALIDRLRCQLDTSPCAVADTSPQSPMERKGYAAFDRAAAHALYAEILGESEQLLDGKQTLYFSFGGKLGLLPATILLTEPPKKGSDDADPKQLAKAEWLSERFRLVSLPSVSALGLGAGRVAAKTSGFIGYGGPVLGGTGDAAAARGVARNPALFRSGGSLEASLADPALLRQMPDLPGTVAELNAMATALDAAPGAIRIGTAATERAVREDERLATASIIAFATHGILPDEVLGVAEPGLVFTPPAKPGTEDDGLLGASEVAAMRLAADWVVLSACNTASADGPGASESLSSLSRAFLFAGARALLASHWSISDDVTALLTVETLKRYRDHPQEGKPAAFQQALRAIRTGKRDDGSAIPGWRDEWSHPAYWGPFSLIAASGG